MERVRNGQILAVEAALERVTEAREAVSAIPGAAPEGLLAELQQQEAAIREAEPAIRETAAMYRLLMEAGEHLSERADGDPELVGLLQEIVRLRERVERNWAEVAAEADG